MKKRGRKPGVRMPHTIQRDDVIIELMGEGLYFSEIADRLCIAESHVSNIVSHLRRVKKCKTNAQLVLLVYKEKLEFEALQKKSA